MIIKKKLILFFGILIFLPLVLAGTYGSGIYGAGNYSLENISTPTPTPTPDSPSGGGGSSCKYNWECTKWFPSLCPESGIQERLCVNKGDCAGIKGMPSQTRTCEYLGPDGPLFDIYLILSEEDKEVCSGGEIKANVRLENYGKLELLDAFMTYWIVDENNKLIVELKDTRAVEKEANFNIELNIPESVSPGIYKLYSEITYDGDKTALAGETFEILSKENCDLLSSKNFNWNYLIYGIFILIVTLLIGILIKIAWKLKKKNRSHREYNKKIQKNIKKIKSKNFLMLLTGLTLAGILLVGRKSMTGFMTRSFSEKINWNILGFILILSVLVFLVFYYQKNILDKFKEKKNKYPKESLKGLIKKKVYAEEGYYIGKIEDIFLGENKIDSLRIRLNKKHKVGVKGFIVSFKDVIGLGEVVIVKNVSEILKKLKIRKL